MDLNEDRAVHAQNWSLTMIRSAESWKCPNVSTGLPKQDSGHWWSSFFFGKQQGMRPLTEEKWVSLRLFRMNQPPSERSFTLPPPTRAEVSGAATVANMSCVAREMVMQRQVSQSSDAGSSTSWTTPHRGGADQWPTLGVPFLYFSFVTVNLAGTLYFFIFHFQCKTR